MSLLWKPLQPFLMYFKGFLFSYRSEKCTLCLHRFFTLFKCTIFTNIFLSYSYLQKLMFMVMVNCPSIWVPRRSVGILKQLELTLASTYSAFTELKLLLIQLPVASFVGRKGPHLQLPTVLPWLFGVMDNFHLCLQSQGIKPCDSNLNGHPSKYLTQINVA